MLPTYGVRTTFRLVQHEYVEFGISKLGVIILAGAVRLRLRMPPKARARAGCWPGLIPLGRLGTSPGRVAIAVNPKQDRLMTDFMHADRQTNTHAHMRGHTDLEELKRGVALCIEVYRYVSVPKVGNRGLGFK